MKKYRVIKTVLCIFWLLSIFVLLGKNIDFFRSKILPDSYDKVEARITDIRMRYNHFYNLKTEVTYIYKGYEKTAQIYFIIGDAVNKKVWLMISDDKIVRNHFVLDWADLQCIVVLGLLIYLVNKKCQQIHYQAAVQYAKKMYERQSKKEKAGYEKNMDDKVELGEESEPDGVKLNEIIGEKEGAVIVASIILCMFVARPAIYLLLLCIVIVIIGISMLMLKDKLKAMAKHKKNILAEKRTFRLICTVTKVENQIDPIEYKEHVRIYCEYVTAEDKRYKFKSEKKWGITECKVGDSIGVLVDPYDYNNYFVQIQGVVHD